MSSTSTFVAQIAPQRSTQYANLARDLAAAELLASPLGKTLVDVTLDSIAGQDYLKFTTSTGSLSSADKGQLASMAMVGNVFGLFQSVGGIEGPLLQPIEVSFPFFVSPELASIRRYKGKTSEFFTQFICNMTKFASGFREAQWHDLNVLDPLCGGGTTMFVALAFGSNVAGIEKNQADVESTATFITQYCRENRIPLSIHQERWRKSIAARRWLFKVGKAEEGQRQCMLASGDAAHTKEFIAGFGRPHLIVTDLPYGIQHNGPLAALLKSCLPGWASVLQAQGCIGFSWDSTRFSREEMIKLVEDSAPLQVIQEAPYDSLAHRVDRVIKRRDVIVARAA